jgi:23S rRNA (cytosine1962-C5)-methyltransferase
MEDRRALLAEILAEETGVRGVLLRRVPRFETAEGLAGAEGDLLDEPVPAEIEARESGVRFLVRPRAGQKTGHYADHRENRVHVRAVAGGRRVLDAFTGTGGFAISAALGGATEVLAIDSSPAALETAGRNAERNGVTNARFEKDDVFRALRRLEADGERFGLIVLDPPRMAARKREIRGALRGYKELNLRAMRLLDEGGFLATASCTGLVADEAFERTVRDAALDARVAFTVLRRGGQAPDHPWTVAAPEGRYLKFLLGRVTALG